MSSIDLDQLVQPDRVHKSVYTDQQLFDLEMEHIFEKAWVYCGHESQVKEVGDYFTMQIGRQPMVMVRDDDKSVKVLYNRCPHRGVELCGNQSGNTGKGFVCSYHAWSFHLNGKIKAIPLVKGYDGTRMTPDTHTHTHYTHAHDAHAHDTHAYDPQCTHMATARV